MSARASAPRAPRRRGARATLVAAALAALASPPARGEEARPGETRLDVRAFTVERSQSGLVSYYEVVDDAGEPVLRATYRPPLDTVTLGAPVPDALRRAVKRVRWRWRAQALPAGGDECRDGRNDSSAAVYLVYKRALRWYALKYVWSAGSPRGSVCAKHRNPFTAQDSIVLESGGPLGVWVDEEVDTAAEFRAHFAAGDPSADVPELVALAVMTDGDQTQSASAADYAAFTLVH